MRQFVTGFALGLATAGLAAFLYVSTGGEREPQGGETDWRSRELDPPPMARKSADAREVLRVWASPGTPQHLTLRTTWKDPGAWGLMLVDIAKHARNAYARDGHDAQATLARIRELFDAEWATPTDPARPGPK
ncbi:MAG: DUF5076 domain-containing protein [Planctomycetota bacterium]|nr:DUF5076 domain-containing protein [Planctomycetota bacterium]